jgi:UDP-glucose 4-epimerase
MSNILITGSSGYIGQHLAKLLQNKGHTIYGLDIVENLTNIDHFYPADIRNNNLPSKEFDAVIHLAALVNVGDSVNRPFEYYDTNLFGTKNILEKINFRNFIFASTGAAEKCESPYGTSKRAAEDVVRNYCKGNPHTIFRFYNVIGSDGILPTNPDGLFFNLIKKAALIKYGWDENLALN